MCRAGRQRASRDLMKPDDGLNALAAGITKRIDIVASVMSHRNSATRGKIQVCWQTGKRYMKRRGKPDRVDGQGNVVNGSVKVW
ncbi:hypothetical protein AWC35_17775 [Gibbsiella quercinecans]|uniref:Uncharacterized protein n=1 Tax=Gibbsiella quercinecans TaxID=929813 RepID=A0A250B539_9GAMM|nr:hypothetical protein AWC35_17775 [Gibbsiella quercinecans]RLM11688.1 hypothetical protein BIY30_07910 [Gibbsiella quercinecans]